MIFFLSFLTISSQRLKKISSQIYLKWDISRSNIHKTFYGYQFFLSFVDHILRSDPKEKNDRVEISKTNRVFKFLHNLALSGPYFFEYRPCPWPNWGFSTNFSFAFFLREVLAVFWHFFFFAAPKLKQLSGRGIFYFTLGRYVLGVQSYPMWICNVPTVGFLTFDLSFRRIRCGVRFTVLLLFVSSLDLQALEFYFVYFVSSRDSFLFSVFFRVHLQWCLILGDF